MADDTTAASDPAVVNESNQPDELAQLRAELAEARRAAEAANAGRESERQARMQAEQRGMSAEEKRALAEETSCQQSIDSMTREADGLEADIARLADEPGHGAEIAKMNRRLASLESSLQTERQRKEWLSRQREAAKTAPVDNGRKLANGASLSQFAPKVRAWFEAHPKCFEDRAYLDRAIGAAEYATKVKGFAEQSDDYFRFVESELDGGTRPTAAAAAAADQDGEDLTPDVRGAQRAAGPGSMRTAMAAVAPPTRTTASGSSRPGAAPLLSPEEREVADGLYRDMANPADRYLRYATNKERRAAKQAGRPFGAN